MTTALGAAFAAAVRMVDRVHRRAAHRRADAAPALRAGRAERTQIVLIVADLADYCAAFRGDLAGLARAESQRRVRTFFRHELHAGAGAARELGAAARHHLGAVDRGADGDVAQRQAVAGLDRRIARADQLRTGLDAFGRDNITAFAIGVYQQCDMGAAVRIVFQTLDHAGAADLVATETAAAILEALDQRLVRPALVQARLHHLDYKAAAGGGRRYFNQCHRLYPSLQLRGELLRARELNVETRLQLHIRLFAVIAAPHHLAEALGLAQAVHRADVLDLDAEHLLDGLFDLGLIGIARHLKYELAIAIGRHRALSET